MTSNRRLLFVCLENSNRSQMAEAFARMLGGDAVQAFSAGSKPSGKINPKAVELMQHFGYDLSAHHSKSLDELPMVKFDAVVTMGCGDSCPHIPAKSRADWVVPNPRDFSKDEYRKVCCDIRDKVLALLAGYGIDVPEGRGWLP